MIECTRRPLRSGDSNRAEFFAVIIVYNIQLAGQKLSGAIQRTRRMAWLYSPSVCEELETVCETRRTRASFTRGPGGLEDGWSQRYSTSTVMVWVAVTRSWSFVAPFTVILCSPLLRPLS